MEGAVGILNLYMIPLTKGQKSIVESYPCLYLLPLKVLGLKLLNCGNNLEVPDLLIALQVLSRERVSRLALTAMLVGLGEDFLNPQCYFVQLFSNVGLHPLFGDHFIQDLRGQ